MLNGNSFRKTVMLGCMLVVFFLSFGVLAGDVAVRKDGSMIYAKDDGTWILGIPSEITIRVAANKRDHELWAHPAVEKRLKKNGMDPENLSFKEAKQIFDKVREGGLKKYKDEYEKIYKSVKTLKASSEEEQNDVVQKRGTEKKKKIYGVKKFSDLPSVEEAATMTDIIQRKVEEKLSHYVVAARVEIDRVGGGGGYKVEVGNGEEKEFQYRIRGKRVVRRKIEEIDGASKKKHRAEKLYVGRYIFYIYTNNNYASRLEKGKIAEVRGVVVSFQARRPNRYGRSSMIFKLIDNQ